MFMDVKAAAKYLGLSTSTLNKLRCTGDGPRYYKLGKPIRYTVEDLLEWAKEQLRLHTSAPMPLTWAKI